MMSCMRLLLVLLFLFLKMIPIESHQSYHQFYKQLISHFSISKASQIFIVDVEKQQLIGMKNDVVFISYPISTSRFGVGAKKYSYKTPPGLHQIAHKVGDGEPLGMIFKSKKAVGRLYDPIEDQNKTDIITTRILHLKGLEKGVNLGGNVDSYQRAIYIHGTHQESRIGTPASRGCIRMLNRDVLALYENVKEGDWVYITRSMVSDVFRKEISLNDK